MSFASNPAFRDSAARGECFAGREHDLAELLRAARENIDRRHNQHVLVLGPRGMGKTALLRHAVDLLRRDVNLAATWFPLVAPEELYLAGNLGEFWLELVGLLAFATGDARHREAFAALKGERDDGRLAAAALAHLLDFADAQGRRLLLVVENLDLLFGDQLDERAAWGFREVLLHERRIMVLASATALFSGLRQPDAALYELFLVHPLEPLDPEAAQALWRSVAGTEPPGRLLRPLELIASGNPRLLTLLAARAGLMPRWTAVAAVRGLLDAQTDYYKLTTEALPALERKVFVTLALLWEEAPAAKVAAEARLDVNVASAQLARLETRGLIRSRRQGRGKYYWPADALFSVYLLFRRPGGSSPRLMAALAFLDLPHDGESPLAGCVEELQSMARVPNGVLVESALHLASAGQALAVLDLVAASPAADLLEPLVLALRLHLDQPAKGPALLMAIAWELVRELRKRASP